MFSKFVQFPLFFALILFSVSSTAAVTPWIDFTLDDGHIKIPVKVAGVDTFAILDTGATIQGINAAFLEKHDLSLSRSSKMRITGAFGTEERKTYTDIPINIFGMDTKLNRVPEMTLGDPSNGVLIGGAFFQSFIVQLDYPNQRMRMLTRDAIDLDKYKNIDLRVDKETGRPIAKLGLPEERSAWFLFDTGATGGIAMQRSMAEKMDWLSTLEVEGGISAGVNKEIGTDNFRVPWVKFGPYELENVLVTIPGEGESSKFAYRFSGRAGTKLKGERIKGLIGYDLFKHFVITIDYRRGKAHIGLPQT